VLSDRRDSLSSWFPVDIPIPLYNICVLLVMTHPNVPFPSISPPYVPVCMFMPNLRHSAKVNSLSCCS
jgi:hypothetical protein